VYLEVSFHALKVETDSALVKVSVAANLEARVTEDGSVVTPGRRREVDDFGFGVVASNESTTNTKSTSSRNGLSDSNLTWT